MPGSVPRAPGSPSPSVAAPQSLSCVRLFAAPRTAARQASLYFTISQNLLKLMSIESVMPSNPLIFCHPLLLPSIFPSIRVFSMSQLIFCFSISSSNEYSRLISFRTDWFDLLAVQRTLESLLQQHSSKSISSSVVSLLYGPTLTSIYDYWKYHSFDLMDLCR